MLGDDTVRLERLLLPNQSWFFFPVFFFSFEEKNIEIARKPYSHIMKSKHRSGRKVIDDHVFAEDGAGVEQAQQKAKESDVGRE